MYAMRESMPHFVASLRNIDEWKRIHAKRASSIIEAERAANAKYIKNPFARSLNVDELLRFIDDTKLDINFMVQLPSIEKCLDQWWHVYGNEHGLIDQDQMKAVYYDLANVLVEAKTEAIHKSSVSMIVKGNWTKWSQRESALQKKDFYRELFLLAHLMTETSRLGDYVAFFQELYAKIHRYHQTQQRQVQSRQRLPRSRRKSTMRDIVRGKSRSPPSRSSSMPVMQPAKGNQTLRVKLERVPTQRVTTVLDVNAASSSDRFVEVLERRKNSQHISDDPMLRDERFQGKWSVPDMRLSSHQSLAMQNPIQNKYFPPMHISKARFLTASKHCQRDKLESPPHNSMSKSISIAELHHAVKHPPAALEDEKIRRSLSHVVLKGRWGSRPAPSNSKAFDCGQPSRNQTVELGIST